MKKLTFAIPYHSGPQLLEAAIQSVLRQTSSDWECLVCDDSPDGDAEAIRHPRVRYVRNPNPAGMVANWNFCLRSANTEWVTLLHADDELRPGYAATLLDGIRRYPGAAAYYCQGEIIDSEGKSIFSFPDRLKRWLDPSRGNHLRLVDKAGVMALLRGNFILCPTMTYRRETAISLGFRPEYRMAQDLDFYFRLLFRGDAIQGLGATEYRYRRHSSNASAGHTRDRSRFLEEDRVYDEVEAECERRGWTSARRLAKRRTILKLHLAYLMLGEVLSGRWKNASQDARRLVWSQ